jgi:hypothetical protein
VGEGAVGAAAVGDDLTVARQLGQPPPQLRDRDRDRPGQVAGGVLGGGPHVQDDQAVTVPEPARQLLAGDRLQLVAPAQVGGGQPLDLGQPAGGQGSQGPPELEHLRPGQPVVDRGALPPGGDQAGLAQDLQVLAGVGHRQAGLAGQGLHGALAVRQHVQQLDPPAAGNRSPHPGRGGRTRLPPPRGPLAGPFQVTNRSGIEKRRSPSRTSMTAMDITIHQTFPPHDDPDASLALYRDRKEALRNG